MKRWLILWTLLTPMVMFAQRQRNYIYLFDCTKSMITPNNVWESSKKFLKEDIEQLDENANVTIILFHQDASVPIRFRAKDFDCKEVEKRCEAMIEQSRYTGICNAWDNGLKFIDKKRNNYLYLFTDGTENVHPCRTDAVCDRIKGWCQQASNNYAFVVALGDEMKNKPDVKKLIDATDVCDRTFYINDHQGPFGAFDKTSFNLNSHSIKNIQVGFSDYGTFPASVVCNDPYYNVSLQGNEIKHGKAVFVVEQKKQPMCNHQVHFVVKAKENVLHICNPDLFVNVDTRDLANLDLAQPSGETEGQYDAGEAETYSSFLFCDGKETDTIHADLGAIFNNQAKKSNGRLNVFLNVPSELKGKCKIYYNGECVESSFVINSSDTCSMVTLVVPHSIEPKEYVIGINGIGDGLETINAEENLSYDSSIYFNHEVCWHPIKVLCMYVGIVILILLILWFLVVRPMVYPSFGSIQKTFFVPGMPPLVIRFKGARMVVLAASHQNKQSVWNRIWTGKILYKTHPSFTSPIVMRPLRGRKVLVKADNSIYHVLPNPMPGVGTANIDIISSNIHITVN